MVIVEASRGTACIVISLTNIYCPSLRLHAKGTGILLVENVTGSLIDAKGTSFLELICYVNYINKNN